MEALCRSESSGIVLDLVLMSVMESAVMEMVSEAGKFLFWLICVDNNPDAWVLGLNKFIFTLPYLKHVFPLPLLCCSCAFYQVESTHSGADLFGAGCEIIKGFPLSSIRRIKGESMPENKDDGESDDEDEDDEDGGEQDDDGGEEDYSGEEGNEEDDEEDELEPNGAGAGGGGGGGGGSDDDEDDDDEDDEEDGDDEDDEDDEEDEEDQPPPKKRR